MTPKRQRFVEEYLIDLNATQAAIRAGFAPGSADVTGARLLGNASVAAAIAKAQAERSERTQIDADWVLRKAVELHDKALEAGAFAPAKGAIELVGKHVDVQAFRERVEHTGRNGGPIDLRALNHLTDEELDQLERLAAKLAISGSDQG